MRGVNCPRAFRWSALLLLALTLGWKLWVAAAPADAGDVKPAVAEFLSRHQFSVVLDKETLNGLPVVITAKSDRCRLYVVETTPLGDPVDPVDYLAEETDRTFVVFGGAVYDREPVFLTLGNYVWYTLLCRLGLASHIPRVLAVISSCDAASLPWHELGSI